MVRLNRKTEKVAPHVVPFSGSAEKKSSTVGVQLGLLGLSRVSISSILSGPLRSFHDDRRMGWVWNISYQFIKCIKKSGKEYVNFSNRIARSVNCSYHDPFWRSSYQKMFLIKNWLQCNVEVAGIKCIITISLVMNAFNVHFSQIEWFVSIYKGLGFSGILTDFRKSCFKFGINTQLMLKETIQWSSGWERRARVTK